MAYITIIIIKWYASVLMCMIINLKAIYFYLLLIQEYHFDMQVPQLHA